MKSSYNGKAVPSEGKPIGYGGGELQVPDTPIIPFIEGDGTGRDIWKASRRVFDAAVEHAYGGKRRVAWFEVFAGEKASRRSMSGFRTIPLTLSVISRGHQRTLTTPVGGGIRSLNVALRQLLDLYSCERPVRYLKACRLPCASRKRWTSSFFARIPKTFTSGSSGNPVLLKRRSCWNFSTTTC